jgi:ribosomal protein S18 acetylase RimI-like enzyme
MNTPTVREVRPEDEHEVAEVDRLATDSLRKVYRPTDLALRRRTAIVPNSRRLVAVLEGRVVGIVQFHISEDHLFFFGLGVHPSFRRRGAAGALIGQLETIGRNRGCTAVILHTVRETGNVDVFQRLGFRVESEEPTTLFESDRFSALSEVVMRKDITRENQRPIREEVGRKNS